MFWSNTFEFGARVTFWFMILVGLSSIWPDLLKYCNIYTFVLKCYIQWPYATCNFILILEENRVVYNLSYKYCLCIFIIKKIMFIYGRMPILFILLRYVMAKKECDFLQNLRSIYQMIYSAEVIRIQRWSQSRFFLLERTPFGGSVYEKIYTYKTSH